MTGPLAGDLARQQLGELISILGELRNAGPRDQRFKQWRQITTTLLQRIWPGERARAEQFRRIPFSAPTAFADRHATKDYFERGCREAAAYLNELALELDGVAAASAPPTDQPDLVDAPAADEIEGLDLPAASRARPASLPNESAPVNPPAAADEPPARSPLPPPPVAWREEPSTSHPRPAPVPMDPGPEGRESAAGPKARLKDMLGFTEKPESGPPHPRTEPIASRSRAPVTFVPLVPDPPPGDRVPPTRNSPPAVSVPRAPAAVEPPAVAPPPTVSSNKTAESLPGSQRRPTPEQSAQGTESKATSTPGATGPRGLQALSGQLEALGVPARERPMVRAALVDLGRQMEAPPIHWDALREVVGFAMNHPALARHVLPLILPYLDRAA
jgi:hypothetical protein